MRFLSVPPGALWLACALVLAGCRQSQAAPAEAPPEAVHVDTVDVVEQPMPRSLALTGTLHGSQQTELAANANGRVLKTFVERGTEVKQGDLVATLDVRTASLSAAEAQANAALARAQAETATRECARYRKLVEQGAISAAEFDRTSDACRTTPLSVEAAQARAHLTAMVVSDGAIRAPFSGVVTSRNIEPGEYVHQDTRVISLVALDPLKLELTVPEASIAAVHEGGLVTFTVPAYPDRQFSGTLRYVGAAVRETTRDLVAEALVTNTDRSLRPGMFAAVSLITGERPTPVLPRSAIVQRDSLTHVFAVVNQRIEERVVQTGSIKGDLVSIERGVSVGEKVVNKPSPTLRNGQSTN